MLLGHCAELLHPVCEARLIPKDRCLPGIICQAVRYRRCMRQLARLPDRRFGTQKRLVGVTQKQQNVSKVERKINSAATSFASAAASSCSGMPDTAAIRLKEKSRPIAAPICATFFTDARWSRR